jgi:hypothetical protein
MLKLVDSLPYPGLRSFQRDEAHLFFGRDDCIDDMIDRLARSRFLAVLGASGSGKSSLVRTGLLSSLDLGFFARAGARWSVVEFTPGGRPLRNLAGALQAVDASDAGLNPELLAGLLARGPRSIAEWCLGGGIPEGHNLLILADQFEELFRYGDYAGREEAEAFIGLLLESARAPDIPIHVVLTMRSEYIGACALFPGLAEEINAGFYLTPRMSREECRSAIEGPAAIAGFDIEPVLVNQILNALASFAPWEEERGVAQSQLLSRRADQLPLMQHLLNRLWLRARARARAGEGEGPLVLRYEDYEDVGGLAGALDAHGAEILATLDAADRAAVPAVFRALVSGPDPTNAIRRPCRFDQIAADVAGGHATARRIVDTFRAADCNFLRPPIGEPLDDGTLVDISHESLIRQWSLLSEWLREEARAGANWRRLLVAADRHAAGEGDLLAGLDLASLAAWWDAERPTPVWAERHGGRFDEVAVFLTQSREAADEAYRREEQRATRERRRLVGGIAVLLLLVVGMIGLSIFALNQATDALAQRQQADSERQRAIEDRQRAVASLQALNVAQNEIDLRRAEAAGLAAQVESQQARVENLRQEANEQVRRGDAAERQAREKVESYRETMAEGLVPLLRRLDEICEQGYDDVCAALRSFRNPS